MSRETEIKSLVMANAFAGWLLLTMILLVAGWAGFGKLGLAGAIIVLILVGWRITRYSRIQELAHKIHYLHTKLKLHATRPCLINENETNQELELLKQKLARKYNREVVI